MIIDGFMVFIAAMLGPMWNLIDFGLTIDYEKISSYVTYFVNFIVLANKFLPIKEILPLFAISLMVDGFIISVAIFRFVKGCIPGMSD